MKNEHGHDVWQYELVGIYKIMKWKKIFFLWFSITVNGKKGPSIYYGPVMYEL